MDAAGGAASAQLAQLQKDLASACDYRPTTLTAARLCLDRLATSAAEVVGSLDGDSESHTKRWARAFARQCQDALDELTFLAPWILLPTSQDRPGDFGAIDEIPTLRELAGLEDEVTAGNRGSARIGCATPEEGEWLAEIQTVHHGRKQPRQS